MKICNKILGIAYQLNVEDSAHSFLQKYAFKTIGRTDQRGKRDAFQQSRKTSCPQVISHYVELETTSGGT